MSEIKHNKAGKVAVIDVGGGQRGIYGAGVFDTCLDDNVRFDMTYGISAGSANVTSYLAGQRGRNYVYYSEYCLRKEYKSFKVLMKAHAFIDLHYVYETLSNSDGEYPLDYPAMMANPAPCTVIATEAETGFPHYFTKADFAQDQYQVIIASCSVPVFTRPAPVGKHLYFDGAISNPIPIQKAFDDGADAVVLILTRPKDFFRKTSTDAALSKILKHRYPEAAKVYARRALTYNRDLRKALELEKQGRVLIVAPDSIAGMKTLGTDPEAGEKLYHKGLEDGKAIAAFVERWQKR
ncbi:patatin-like phospholipase family protein [Pseudoramibacter porci]|uniref:Patatin family protein n=1 Tax=Pseudoramibacter porci TaxID=2606631 RepID=A0A7X2NFY2_9FIRM|nr:patatin family protein [Pseudoramibacter porci]MSS19728.1 patatin family protein [Pseudoramibacter porci]